MLTLWRRHDDTCRYKQLGRKYYKCNCPVWIDGHDEENQRKRHSLATRDWALAQQYLARFIQGGPAPAPVPQRTLTKLSSAIEDYLAEAASRKLASSTIKRYRNALDPLREFCTTHADIRSITLDQLTRFRAQRMQTAEGSSGGELTTLRSFFKYALDRGWVDTNHAMKLRYAKIEQVPTLPFTVEETEWLLTACAALDNPNPHQVARSRARARALVLLLLYSGLRISDAIKLPRSHVDMTTGRILLRMMKTRQPLYVRVPQIVLEALRKVPVESLYWFWSGKSTLESGASAARHTIRILGQLAGIEDCHPHRFRDTFAVRLLEAGVDIKIVSRLLGHTSVQTTEKHYAPWVTSMQNSLDAAVTHLHFGLPAPLGVNAQQDAVRNAQGNVLPFSAPPTQKAG